MLPTSTDSSFSASTSAVIVALTTSVKKSRYLIGDFFINPRQFSNRGSTHTPIWMTTPATPARPVAHFDLVPRAKLGANHVKNFCCKKGTW